MIRTRFTAFVILLLLPCGTVLPYLIRACLSNVAVDQPISIDSMVRTYCLGKYIGQPGFFLDNSRQNPGTVYQPLANNTA